jgi:hypothetical protein
MKPESTDTAREILSAFAGLIDHHADKIERAGIELSGEIEDLASDANRYDLPTSALEKEYDVKGEGVNRLLIKTDSRNIGQVVRLASGCDRVPLSAEIKQKLKLYEYALPSIIRKYDELAFVDELWLFESKSNIALGCLQWQLGEHILPGMDATLLFDLGITFYDWFRHVDRERNPDRKSLWSPMPFIEMFNQWIMHLTSPVYVDRYEENEEMIGIIGIHLNLDWVLESTICTSTIPMMMVKDDATLVGMNSAAGGLIELERFCIDNYSYDTVFNPEVIAGKKAFVFETLNLEHNKPAEVVSFFQKIKAEHQFRHSMFGKKFHVVREYASTLGCYIIALLDSGE